uniref:Uncharacterized protein n=1 Tax=Rhodnius prolixus TaxID=13249 RepID=T1HIM5_RHOPR
MDRRPQSKKGVPLSGPMVREKAKYLYAHFKEPDGSCSDYQRNRLHGDFAEQEMYRLSRTEVLLFLIDPKPVKR